MNINQHLICIESLYKKDAIIPEKEMAGEAKQK